ncbi:MAG: GAF domain-containing protein [Gammaproteobacteria bacterium]|nr:GAF domain-containing protein [Gammaproteobacteria bacterium]
MAEQENSTSEKAVGGEITQLCSVLDLCEYPVYCVSPEGRIVGTNLSAANVLSRPREKLIGRHVRNVDPRVADWPAFFSTLQKKNSMRLDPVFEGTDPRISSRVLFGRLWQSEGGQLAVIALRDIRRESEQEDAMVSRDAILQTISTAAARYLADDDWDDSCNQLLRDLGEATGVSRVYIFEAHYDSEESLLFSQRFEWVAPEIEPQIDNEELQDLPMEQAGYGRWLKLLSRGRLVAGQVRDFPASERDLLESQSIAAIAVVPIFTGSKWWGCMGFDECSGPRDWGVAETEALRTVASLFGLAIERREAAIAGRAKRDNIAHEARLVAMGEMASSVAHEINQPLAAISNYCETGISELFADARDDEILERALRGAAAQAQRAGEIIRRLREFVRKGDTTRTVVDLKQLIEETVGLVAHDARARKIRIADECAERLPAIEVCRIQIQQVLFNLLRNAIEAIEDNEHSDERLITIRAASPGAHSVEISVADTGPGLKPDSAASIFEPFETSKPYGMGLGLSISRSILEAHGGSLSAVKNTGSGACFEIRLPLAEGTADA